MEIKVLKKNIVNHELSNDIFLVFVYCDSTFIPLQYAKEISSQLNKNIVFIESVNEQSTFNNDCYSNDINIIIVDKFNYSHDLINTIVICKETNYDDYIKVPEIESWHRKEFVKSMLSGVPDKKAAVFDTISDIFLLDTEIHKLSIFPKQLQNNLFDQFIRDGIFFNDKKDDGFQKINDIIENNTHAISSWINDETNGFGLLQLLYNRFEQIILCLGQKNPTEKNTKLTSKQIWAIRKYTKLGFTLDECQQILRFLGMVEYNTDSGYIPRDYMVDYIIVKIINFHEMEEN